MPAVARRGDAKLAQQAPEWTVPAILDALLIFRHRCTRPTGISGLCRDKVPITRLSRNEDHRVMGSTSAERSRPRVKYSLIEDAFLVARGLRFVTIMLDEEVPGHRRALGSEWMKGGNVVVARKAVGVELGPGVAASL